MQSNVRRKSTDTQKLVLFSLFTALVIVLQCLASFAFPKIGVSINLSLIPVVLGAALCNKWAGAWLGLVSSFIILFDPTTVAFMTFNAPATVFLVLLKGTASGLLAGIVYEVLKKHNQYISVIVSAFTAPVVNTGIFFIGCFTLFYDLISEWSGDSSMLYFVIVVMIGTNFLIELGLNLLLSPTILRLLNLRKK